MIALVFTLGVSMNSRGFTWSDMLNQAQQRIPTSTVIEVIFNSSSKPRNSIFCPVAFTVISGKDSLNLNK